MHATSAEVSQFLDRDLLPQVQTAFGQYKSADKADIEKELAKVIAGIEAAGMDPRAVAQSQRPARPACERRRGCGTYLFQGSFNLKRLPILKKSAIHR